MSEHSHIEWTDATFNPWRGCTKVSPGCAHCYAETLSKRNPAVLGQWGKGAPRVQASESYWRQPLKWNQDARRFGVCERCGPMNDLTAEGRCPCCSRADLWERRRMRVFCASLSDWLDDEVPIEWLARLLALIRVTPHLDWLLLTKRPQAFKLRILQVVAHRAAIISKDHRQSAKSDPLILWLWEWTGNNPPANVWIGTSVEDQVRADERIPALLGIPAKVRFLSCEPLLGPVNLCPYRIGIEPPDSATNIHWVICGGESGLRARPMHPDWARGLRDQCAAAGVPFLFKQWGEWLPFEMGTGYMDHFAEWKLLANGPVSTGWPVYRVGKKLAGREIDGREHNGFPICQP